MTRTKFEGISPSFIVSNVDQTIAFYRDKLGFETRFREPDVAPFFAILSMHQIPMRLPPNYDGLRGFEDLRP